MKYYGTRIPIVPKTEPVKAPKVSTRINLPLAGKTCYFSHAIASYGSPEEKAVRDWLECKYTVLCPHRDINELGSLEAYLELICPSIIDFVAVRGIEDMIVAKGSYEEIRASFTSRIPVFAVLCSENGFYLKEIISVQLLNSGFSWKRYGKIVH